MKTSELLTAGADVIVRNGWVQGDHFEDVPVGAEDGAAGPWLPVRECPVCPRGAIAIAAGGHPMDYAWGWGDNWDRHMGRDVRDRAAAVLAAEVALTEHLRGVWPEAVRLLGDGVRVDNVIERWADEDGRTLEEILAAMRAAAERERGEGR